MENKITSDIYSDRAEDISSEDLESKFVEAGEVDASILRALMSPGTHLLEGSRGTGKTMLLKVAHERLSRQAETKNTTLPVFVRFPNYLSTYNPGTQQTQNFSPFEHWVVAKLVEHTYTTAYEQIRDQTIDISDMPIIGVAHSYIQRLEEHYRDMSVGNIEENARLLSVNTNTLESFGRLDEVANILLRIAGLFNYKKIALFLDEAAQNFAEDLQPIFFRILKHLRHERISVKAAVYPFVTSYGKDFDIGQDAIILKLDRSFEESSYDSFYQEFFRKRIGETPFGRSLLSDLDTQKFLRVASGGNPRWILHILSRISLDRERVLASELNNAVKAFSDETLLPFLERLGARLRSRRKYVDISMALAQIFAEDIRSANKDSVRNTKPMIYLAVSNSKVLPFAIHQALAILVYCGILCQRGPKRLSYRENGQLYLLHPALLIRENALYVRDSNPSPAMIAYAYTGSPRERFKEYTKNSPRLLDAVPASGPECISICEHCEHFLPDDAKFCPNCGRPVVEESPYAELLQLPSSTLEITSGIKSRLLVDGRFLTVGSIISASDLQLQEIPYIGRERSRIIRYAAEEVLAG